jgi:hypothetical protein
MDQAGSNQGGPQAQAQAGGQNWQNWAAAGAGSVVGDRTTWNQDQKAAGATQAAGAANVAVDASKQMGGMGNLWNFEVPEAGNNVNNNSIWQNLYNNGMGNPAGSLQQQPGENTQQSMQSAWAAQQQNAAAAVAQQHQPVDGNNWQNSQQQQPPPQDGRAMQLSQQQSAWAAASASSQQQQQQQQPVVPPVSNSNVANVQQQQQQHNNNAASSPSPSTYAGAAASGLQSSHSTSNHQPQNTVQVSVAPPPQPQMASMVQPVEWKEYVAPETGEKYYHNNRTGKTQWERPADLGW